MSVTSFRVVKIYIYIYFEHRERVHGILGCHADHPLGYLEAIDGDKRRSAHTKTLLYTTTPILPLKKSPCLSLPHQKGRRPGSGWMSSWFSSPHSDPSEVGDHVGSFRPVERTMVGWQSPLTMANIYTPFISTPTTQHPATT